jgi:hypothetical protein
MNYIEITHQPNCGCFQKLALKTCFGQPGHLQVTHGIYRIFVKVLATLSYVKIYEISF